VNLPPGYVNFVVYDETTGDIVQHGVTTKPALEHLRTMLPAHHAVMEGPGHYERHRVEGGRIVEKQAAP
jgi:hypothetical protein